MFTDKRISARCEGTLDQTSLLSLLYFSRIFSQVIIVKTGRAIDKLE